jgi:UDP-N-acetylglucosamine 3-dehydrogenase
MQQPLRVGMIGVGRHARSILLPALAQIPRDIELVALATAHEETARAVEAQFHIRTHVGYEALVADDTVEAVLVVGGRHGPEIVAALEAGKPVWTETPGISSSADARRIRRLAQERGLTVQVGSCLRYSPLYQKMRALLTDWRRTDPGPRSYAVRYYPYVGHFYNLLLYLGGPIVAVCTLASPDGDGEIVLLRFAGGDTGLLTWRRFNNVSLPYERVEIAHASGLLVAENGRELAFHQTRPQIDNNALSFGDAEAMVFAPTFSIPYGTNTQLYLRGYPPELAHFAHCVRTGEPPICGVDDAERTLLVTQAVRRSAAHAEWVEVAAGSWEDA